MFLQSKYFGILVIITCVTDMWTSMAYKGLNKIAMALRKLYLVISLAYPNLPVTKKAWLLL
jgi:hypothetical protein